MESLESNDCPADILGGSVSFLAIIDVDPEPCATAPVQKKCENAGDLHHFLLSNYVSFPEVNSTRIDIMPSHHQVASTH